MKMMETVGIRELKNRLGYDLRAICQGWAFGVTDRGKPVACLVPVVPLGKEMWPPDLEGRMGKLAAEGILAWTGEPARILRGYDAVHLAAALLWQERVGYPGVLATFDAGLWQAAHRAGLEVWPAEI
jgi:antitoxin (DNA-binding transcriptional repressor) of toxin-antitoxin stability system